MPLDVSALQQALTAAMAPGFATPPANLRAEPIARAIAAAYSTFASAGQACNGLGPIGVKTTDMTDELVAVFTSGGGTPRKAAEEMASAFTTFWDGVTFGTGQIVSGPDANGLTATLESIYNQLPNTFASFIQQFSQALDVFTRSVKVADTTIPTPCGPAPIA